MAEIELYHDITEGTGFQRWRQLVEDAVGGRLIWLPEAGVRAEYPGLDIHALLSSRRPIVLAGDEGRCSMVIPFLDNGALLGLFAVQWEGDYKRPVAENIGHLLGHSLKSLSASVTVYDELEIAHTVWQRLLTSTNVEELGDTVLHEVLSRLRGRHGALFLADEDGNLILAEVKADDPDPMIKRVPEIGLAPYQNQFGTDTLIHLDHSDPFIQWMAAFMSGDEENKPIALRLASEHTFIGMVVAMVPPDTFPEALLEAGDLGMVLEGAAACLANALNIRRIRGRQKALSTIHTVHRLMGICESTQELLPRIAVQAAKLLNANKCSVMRLDEESRTLVPSGQTGLSAGEVGTEPLQAGDGIPGWVAQNYNAALVRHPLEDARFAHENPQRYPDDFYIAVPLLENDIIGVMTVSGREEPFGTMDRDILFALAEQSVVAMQNAEAYDSQRKMTMDALRLIANLFETGDPDAPGAADKVALLAERIGRHLGLKPRELHNVVFAAFLHNAGALTRNELPSQPVKSRVEIGVRMAESIRAPQGVIPIIEHYQANFNGAGSDHEVQGTEIPLGSRIIAVADVFVTLRQDHSLERTLAILRRLSGTKFDPEIVAALEAEVGAGYDV